MKKGIKKKVRTWGPSSIQTKERGNSAERFTTDLYLFMFLILTDQHVYKNLKEASLVVTGKSQVLVVIKFVIVNNFNSLLFSISLS